MLNKRSHWKIPYIYNIFVTKIHGVKKVYKTHNRKTIIPNTLLSKTLSIYNGKKYLPVVIKREMIGHKAGEFAITKVLGYKPKKKRKTQVKRKKN